jgi:multiple sugar transport system permease protein
MESALHGKGVVKSLRASMLLIPSVILMLIFFIFPIVLTLIFSFTNLALTGEAASSLQFIGFDNYKKMFADPSVITSIVNTLIFLVGSSLIGQQLLGFIIAYCMKNKNTIFRRTIGIIVLAGWILPEVVVALCMSTFLGDDGTLNAVIRLFHGTALTWLYTFPMVSIIIANAWHGTAFSMLVFQAALDDVPKDIEEAAIVDGASGAKVLFYITLPYIKGSITTNMMLNTLQTLGVFGLIYMMTGGGPGTQTTTLPILMYNQAFVNYQIGYGTAISMILLVLGVILSTFYTKAMHVKA